MFVCVCGGDREAWWWWWCLSTWLNGGRTASVSSSPLQYQLSQPKRDVIMSAHRPSTVFFFWLILWDNHFTRTPATKKSLVLCEIKRWWFYYYYYFKLCSDAFKACTLIVVYVRALVRVVSVFISERWSRGSISHMWRKWGNLGPGVKKVMDFNAAIVVNGSLN